MSAVFNSVLAQYEKNKQSGSQNRVSQEDRMKKYFTTALPKNSKSAEKRIRILPTKDGSSPFVEVYFHEIQMDGKWVKLYDPKNEEKRSPLNEVYEALKMTGNEEDSKLAMSYRSRKFYIVKIIDRDNEQDGVKFWRFKHNTKQDGAFDKIFPIFQKKGDVTDPITGRDLTLFLSLAYSPAGSEYTTINSIIPEDPEPLHTDQKIADSWVNDELVWTDVYSKKPEEYLEAVAKGFTPKWDNEGKKWVYGETTSEENVGSTAPKAPVAAPYDDPQVNDEPEEDLPF